MGGPAVLSVVRDGVLEITLNRPETLNAMNPEQTQGLLAALVGAQSDPDVRVVVLAGAGRSFCAGGDASILTGEFSPDDFARNFDAPSQAIRLMRSLPVPVVARVQGHAVGAGFSLALAADFVVAEAGARLHPVFVHLGMVPELGATFLLPYLVGPVRARTLALLGEPITGAQAETMDLIYRSVPADRLDGEVGALVARLKALPPRAVGLVKEGLQRGMDSALTAAMEWEQQTQTRLMGDPEVREILRQALSSQGIV